MENIYVFIEFKGNKDFEIIHISTLSPCSTGSEAFWFCSPYGTEHVKLLMAF